MRRLCHYATATPSASAGTMCSLKGGRAGVPPAQARTAGCDAQRTCFSQRLLLILPPYPLLLMMSRNSCENFLPFSAGFLKLSCPAQHSGASATCSHGNPVSTCRSDGRQSPMACTGHFRAQAPVRRPVEDVSLGFPGRTCTRHLFDSAAHVDPMQVACKHASM